MQYLAVLTDRYDDISLAIVEARDMADALLVAEQHGFNGGNCAVYDIQETTDWFIRAQTDPALVLTRTQED